MYYFKSLVIIKFTTFLNIYCILSLYCNDNVTFPRSMNLVSFFLLSAHPHNSIRLQSKVITRNTAVNCTGIRSIEVHNKRRDGGAGDGGGGGRGGRQSGRHSALVVGSSLAEEQ